MKPQLSVKRSIDSFQRSAVSLPNERRQAFTLPNERRQAFTLEILNSPQMQRV